MRRVVVAALFLGFLAAASSSFAADKEPSRGTTASRTSVATTLARAFDRGRSLLIGGAVGVAIAVHPRPTVGQVRHIQCGAVRQCLLTYASDNSGCWYDQDGILHCNEIPPGPCGGQDYQDPGNGLGGY
jgi:hypothetical protein